MIEQKLQSNFLEPFDIKNTCGHHIRLTPCYAEDMTVPYAKDSSHSCSASSSPRQRYDPRILRFIDQSDSESEDEFIP
jgi:hypothetical protein